MFIIVIIVFSGAGRSCRRNSSSTRDSSSIEFLAAGPARIRSGLTESFPSLSYFTALGGAAAVFVVGSRAFIAALELWSMRTKIHPFCVIECTTFLCSHSRLARAVQKLRI